jgi:hypothetical protein
MNFITLIFYYDTKSGFHESKEHLIVRAATHKINRKTSQNSGHSVA